MERRYARNISAISEEENQRLRNKRVCVIGCGGLGGGVIEGLVRIGVGTVVAVDGDVFDETNLNRQILSNEDNIGAPKAKEAARQMKYINHSVKIESVSEFFTEANACEILEGADAVIDALDNVTSRKALENSCEKMGIPLVHGAIAGWNGQVAVIMPGNRIISTVYGDDEKGDETETGNPYFIPAAISSIQVAETVKLLTGKEPSLKNKMLTVDLMHHQYEVIDFGE